MFIENFNKSKQCQSELTDSSDFTTANVHLKP